MCRPLSAKQNDISTTFVRQLNTTHVTQHCIEIYSPQKVMHKGKITLLIPGKWKSTLLFGHALQISFQLLCRIFIQTSVLILFIVEVQTFMFHGVINFELSLRNPV
jgi:hypothetical protein